MSVATAAICCKTGDNDIRFRDENFSKIAAYTRIKGMINALDYEIAIVADGEKDMADSLNVKAIGIGFNQPGNSVININGTSFEFYDIILNILFPKRDVAFTKKLTDELNLRNDLSAAA